jgi:predicted HTH transcriptional regulator
VWGVRDGTREIVGTDFEPRRRKIGNEDLEPWLAFHLNPRIDFRIHEFSFEGHRVVVFEVPAAAHTPVRFRHVEYVRIGSYKKKLADFPEKERTLWSLLSRVPFEHGVAESDATGEQVLKLLDYPSYFELVGQALPENRTGILERLQQEGFIGSVPDARFNITNLGAILFAKNLDTFGALARKAVRVVVYRGVSRVETRREQQGRLGYAAAFARLIGFINDQLPQNEDLGPALRRETRVYPEVAVRELVANALIHQDFHLTGTGPMVEIFQDRVEITNPGVPLVDTLRFMDNPPRSRNETLAAFMRRIKVCEERGSGIDKVVFAVELAQLPAPDFVVTENHTKVVLFGRKTWAQMDRGDRVRACYQHACLMYVSNDRMTNASLRRRFGISDENYSMVSRVISEAIAAELVKPYDPDSGSKRHASYVPFWA